MNKHLQPDERLCDVYSKDDHYGAIIAALLALGSTASRKNVTSKYSGISFKRSAVVFTVDGVELDEDRVQVRHAMTSTFNPQQTGKFNLKVYDGERWHSIPQRNDATFDYRRAALRIKENVAATRSRNARSANQAKNVEITRQFQEDNRTLCASVHDRNMVYPSQSADAPLTVHFNLHVECTPERAANILKALYTQGLIP